MALAEAAVACVADIRRNAWPSFDTAAVDASSSATMLAGASHVHAWQLLTKDHRPLTRYPPATGTARPPG